MSNLNELLASIIIYSLVSYLLNLPSYMVGLLFAVCGSQISTILPGSWRTSFFVCVPMVFLSIWFASIMFPLMIGFLSSILICLLSARGCQLFYPMLSTRFIGPRNYLENDSKGDYAATVLLVVLSVIAIVFSLYGNCIVNILNQTSSPSHYINWNNDDGRIDGYSNGFVHYVDINPAESPNTNITTTHTNNTTTTIVCEYSPPV